MSPAENVKRLVENARIIINPEIKKAALKELVNELNKPKAIDSATTKPSIWRVNTKNPIVKIAAAATMTIACSTGLIFWISTGSGMALADVLAKIEHVTGYTYQMSSTMTRQKTTSKWASTILVSNEYGIKMTVIAADPNSVQSKPRRYGHDVGDEAYLLPGSSSLVFVRHKRKTYSRFIYDGRELEFYKEEYNEPRTIIKQILSCDHKSLGQAIINGITVEGFQTKDLAYEGGFFGQAELEGKHERVDVKLWVDVNTLLPIRLDEDIITKRGTHIREISYDFRWNVIINPDDFEPNIPDDYASAVGDIIIPVINEEDVIEGLRLFNDLVGKYPLSLERHTRGKTIKEVSKHMGFYEGLSNDDKTRLTNKWILLGTPLFFYKDLVKENKDPAYYGETVGPEDSDKVLLRWKLDDGQYRVIFGDLSAKTVTAEELAELENNQ